MDWTRRRLLGATGIAMGLSGCLGSGGGAAGEEGSDGGGGDGTTTYAGAAGSYGGGGGGAASTATASPMDIQTTESPTDAATTTEPARTTATNPTVGVSSHPDLGDVLVGPDGLTLYNFDNDTQGEAASACYDGCANAWPPLTVDDEPSAGEGVTAELTTFERDDGSTQVAANGWPLYYFAGDEAPGDANGQGVNDVWWVLDPGGEPIRS